MVDYNAPYDSYNHDILNSSEEQGVATVSSLDSTDLHTQEPHGNDPLAQKMKAIDEMENR